MSLPHMRAQRQAWLRSDSVRNPRTLPLPLHPCKGLRPATRLPYKAGHWERPTGQTKLTLDVTASHALHRPRRKFVIRVNRFEPAAKIK